MALESFISENIFWGVFFFFELGLKSVLGYSIIHHLQSSQKKHLKPIAPFWPKGLDNSIGNYDDILLLGDFNSEFSELCLNDFCDIYNLKNLVKEPTCYKNRQHPSCNVLFLPNGPKTFQCTTIVETGISDFYKLVITVLKTFHKKKTPKIIHNQLFWFCFS